MDEVRRLWTRPITRLPVGGGQLPPEQLGGGITSGTSWALVLGAGTRRGQGLSRDPRGTLPHLAPSPTEPW